MLQNYLTTMKKSVIKGWQKLPKKRIATFAGMFLCCAVATFAQSKGAGGFQKAITEVSGYQTPVSNLMKAIAAVIALVGAFNVYFKMSNGDQDVKNILVLQNWLERIRKEVTNKVLSIKRISDFLIFPILAQPTLKKI